jgi:glycosyltransferase involved in cell wall biosynthesis
MSADLSAQHNRKQKLISVVVPVFNEEKNIPLLHAELEKVLESLPYDHEIVFVNDGSSDGTAEQIAILRTQDPRIRYREFSRNFGKEIATTAGLHYASGDAVLIIDADLQHPPRVIPQFISEWEKGFEVVVGMRTKTNDTAFRKAASKVFHSIMSIISDTELVSGETDFRLIDRAVLDEFNKFTEHSRMTRGLINWIGFRRGHVYFEAEERKHGKSTYNLVGLIRLAVSSIVQHSLFPLRLGAYFGALIVVVSGALGIVMFLDKFVTHWGFNFSGPAILGDVLLFLVGIILMAIGILAVYIGNIHLEVRNRPLYIIRNTDRAV